MQKTAAYMQSLVPVTGPDKPPMQNGTRSFAPVLPILMQIVISADKKTAPERAAPPPERGAMLHRLADQ